jgi:hypothetical protein
VFRAAHLAAPLLGFSLIASFVATVSQMTASPANPSTGVDSRPSFRLVVKARTSGQKGYVWEIVNEDDHLHRPVRQSSHSYATMEQAYDDGSVALSRVRAVQATA